MIKKKTTTQKAGAANTKAASVKTEPQASVVFQFAGREIAAKEILAAAVDSYKGLNKNTEIKTIELYIKPEENAAYYTVNGEGADEYKVAL
ncbi:MAG: DUF6465 family protein [Enterocloster sp.]